MLRDDSHADQVSARLLPDPALSFLEVFARRAEDYPRAVALTTVKFVKGQPVGTGHSNAELFDRARRCAAALAQLNVRAGDRVALSLSDPAALFAGLLGAQCIGAIPVPVPSAAELRMQACLERIAAIARDSTPRVILVDDPRTLGALQEESPQGAVIVNVLDPTFATGAGSAPPPFRASREPDGTAFLQYTSGSTGAPKGVVVLHRNVIANVRAIIEGGRMDSRDVVFSWLPLFHDMGLVAGLLLGPYLGIPTYVASPSSFVLCPETWLRAIHAFRASFSAAPNFAFDLLARRVAARSLEGVDLSSWRLAFDGAELVDPDTVRAFVSRFGPLGFGEGSLRPAYGLAEATLAVAFPRPGTPLHFDCIDRAALATSGVATPAAADVAGATVFTSVGTPVPGHGVRIVEPATFQELGERRLGEIVVSGPSVTPGYFDELSAGGLPRAELRTGDLGYIADGELYVVDRLKDLIVLSGRKFAPSDLERELGAIPGVRPGAVVAFSARGAAGTEDLYVAAGLEPKASKMKTKIADAICDELRNHFGLTPSAVFLVRPGQLPKTSSGKLRRAECRAMLEAQRFGEPVK